MMRAPRGWPKRRRCRRSNVSRFADLDRRERESNVTASARAKDPCMFLPVVSPLRVRSCIPWTGPLKFPPMNELTFEYAAERLIISAIENSATSVFLTHLPPLVKSDFDASTLSPSLRRHFKVVDRRDNLWAAVRAYFQPIELEVKDV